MAKKFQEKNNLFDCYKFRLTCQFSASRLIKYNINVKNPKDLACCEETCEERSSLL